MTVFWLCESDVFGKYAIGKQSHNSGLKKSMTWSDVNTKGRFSVLLVSRRNHAFRILTVTTTGKVVRQERVRVWGVRVRVKKTAIASTGKNATPYEECA